MTVQADQAMIQAFISEPFGLPIIHDNETSGDDFAPGDEYFEIELFQNEARPISLGGIKDLTGLLQFMHCSPLGSGAIPAKLKAQQVFDAFPAGRRVSYGGQTLVIKSHHLFRSGKNEAKGRFEVVGRINYAAIVSP